jgi:hypothetical protein
MTYVAFLSFHHQKRCVRYTLCRLNIGLCELVVCIFTVGSNMPKGLSGPVNMNPKRQFIVPLSASMIVRFLCLLLSSMASSFCVVICPVLFEVSLLKLGCALR